MHIQPANHTSDSSTANGPEAEIVPLARTSGERFLNRDLSWLDFDRRVLELACDHELPLLERVKLCAIVAGNLDEFFSVRMAALARRAANEMTRALPDGRTAADTINDVRRRVRALQDAQDTLWLDDLQPRLTGEAIKLVGVAHCSPKELRRLRKRFESEIASLLTPIAVSAAVGVPQIPSLTLCLAALVREGTGSGARFVRINLPADVPRFLALGDGGRYLRLEDAVLHFLPLLLEARVAAHAAFRITRDADLSIAPGADHLLEAVESKLQQRRFGSITRLEVEAHSRPELIAMLKRALAVDSHCVYATRAPLALARLMEFTTSNRHDLQYKPWAPVTRRAFAQRDAAAVLARIRRRDVLVHHPYESFDSSVQAFLAAARDPGAVALKATVYRTGDHSPTVDSLVQTAFENKRALALVELQARFDEQRNIGWARMLERAGADVAYGVPGLKVHAKLALLLRREEDRVRGYVHIGTGNYHASNASTYEDLSLFTADEEIAADVAELFNALTAQVQPKAFRKLLVGPWFLREGLLREISRVATAARAGEEAQIRIKVNALVDPEIIDALYAASAAGATVEIITRGICVLRPGVRGLSERITVRSVLGRFLEHSRIYSFQHGSQTAIWIGSADLMPRNLDRRVEVLAPVEDARLRAELVTILDALQNDTSSSWQLDGDGVWHRTQPPPGAPALSAQGALMARAAKRTKRLDTASQARARSAA
jgi:polyphosphate kinase